MRRKHAQMAYDLLTASDGADNTEFVNPGMKEMKTRGKTVFEKQKQHWTYDQEKEH